MSYGLRNTIILSVVLLLILGGGGSYIYYWQENEIDTLTKTLEEKTKTLEQKNQIAARYEPMQKRFREARRILANLAKGLNDYTTPNRVYDYLDEMNRGVSDVKINYTFRDSVHNNRYGVIRTAIQGYGPYANLNNLIMNIEQNRPLHKVRSLNLSPNGDTPENNDVQFSFVLESFFSRDTLLKQQNYVLSNRDYNIPHNPFFPLIRDIPSNEEGLPNVEGSKIAGISPNTVFLLDQNGNLNRLQIGDRVFMGRLTDINFKQRSATFTLNKGGLVEEITLEVTE